MSIFDTSVSKIWRFLQDDNHEHKSVKFSKVLKQTEKYMVVGSDAISPDGKTTFKETAKFTFNPPKGFNMDFLSGPMVGTKHAHAYTPIAGVDPPTPLLTNYK